ncbi:MAG: YbaB/EbfC family nucleoid-associated protein [Fimbriiglobus sp.]
MFGDFGNLMKLLGNKDKIQGEVAKMHEAIAKIVAEGNAGGGMVVVRVSGKFEMLSCFISDAAASLPDRKLLEDLILAATNQATAKAKEQVAAETQRMAQSLGLPASMLGQLGLPGLG